MHVADEHVSGAGGAARRVCNPKILAETPGSFTYASHQNAVPVRSIGIDNRGGRLLESYRIDHSSSPASPCSQYWKIDRLALGDLLELADREIDLDADYLAGLDEVELGEIAIRLFARVIGLAGRVRDRAA